VAFVNVKNLKKVVGGVRVLEQRALKATQGAVRTEGELLMTASQKIVPVKEGFLKNSKFVEDRTARGIVRILIGYSAIYALAVHEIPPPPAQSEGGRSATHKNGQWKFLETPLKERTPGYAERVAKRIRKRLLK